jgi:hypothetical protein
MIEKYYKADIKNHFQHYYQYSGMYCFVLSVHLLYTVCTLAVQYWYSKCTVSVQ